MNAPSGGPKMAHDHNFLFSQILMQICGVLGMQISPFESKKQEEYLTLHLQIFKL